MWGSGLFGFVLTRGVLLGRGDVYSGVVTIFGVSGKIIVCRQAFGVRRRWGGGEYWQHHGDGDFRGGEP